MINNQNFKYNKKTMLSNIKLSLKKRGLRLKKLRNMANLSRQQICSECKLNPSTYKGWEIARHGGLPLNGAKKVIAKFSKIGVTCTLEWLLYGKGNEPFILPKISNHKNNIAKEISLFKLITNNSIAVKVIDNSMYPIFQQGDFVAGIKYYLEDLPFTVGHNCIVQLTNKKILIRKIEKSIKKDHYTLICINQDLIAEKSILDDQKLIFAAPIIRHYKCSTNLT